MASPAASIFNVLNIGFGLVFLLSAAIQYNDPDPIRWMVFYLLSAGLCAYIIYPSKTLVWPFVVSAVISLAWAGYLVPQFYGNLQSENLFDKGGMTYMGVEEAREAVGAALVGFWMLVLAWRTSKKNINLR